MILENLEVDVAEFERRTGWAIKPQGACKGEMCVPLPQKGDRLDIRMLAEWLNMPLVRDESRNLWCLGPESGGRALTTAEAPDLELPDVNGKTVSLRSLRGMKIFLLAWASW